MVYKNISGGEACAAGAVASVQMKEIEKRADDAGLSYYQMMENAGTGAVEHIVSMQPVSGKHILIFCGKGNNGGDGFVAARKLKEKGALVKLVLAEGEPMTEDAIKNKRICERMEIAMIETADGEEIAAATEAADLIIDAIYGTGFHGALREPVRTIIQQINRSRAVVYALDVPSGLSGDTGEADPDTVCANGTIVFHRCKPAHLDERCSEYTGQIACISIGIEKVLKD